MDKMENKKSNYAFIDGQNLYYGTAKLVNGDYKLMVDFLIEENKLEKILFPNRKFASSLYKKLGSVYYDYLDNEGIKEKIGIKKEKGSLGS